MERLRVELGERSYPILIGDGLLSQADLFKSLIRGRRVLVLSNPTIAPLYLAKLKATLAQFQVDELLIDDGEQFKTLASFETVMGHLLQGHHGRDTTLIALGGGVIGDLCGFAAACYLRGVDFIQIPTTLLAQVDSSVGGKTAVNHPLGKNMIGAFYQPQAVVADISVLQTLDTRQFASGLAEVIKYGIIHDGDFFRWLEVSIDALLAQNRIPLTYAVRRSCEIKAQIVALDETEQGCRALLNLGHTFGHAIEVEQGFGHWLHGEAVSVGMVMATRLSVWRGESTPADLERVIRVLQRAKLPISPPSHMTSEQFLQHMQHDKKVAKGQIRVVLPIGIGRAQLLDRLERDLFERLFSEEMLG